MIATLLGFFAVLYLFAFALGGIAGMADANARLMQDRPEPRPNQDTDVYSGCSTVGEEGERLIGLYCADRELRAAASRVEAVR